MAKKKAVIEEGFALKNPTGEQTALPPTEETRPLDEALSDIVAKQTNILKNEPVAITEIKPLSEKVLASLYEKHNVPRDFNASHPRWNVPSVKNRYALLLADISIHEKL